MEHFAFGSISAPTIGVVWRSLASFGAGCDPLEQGAPFLTAAARTFVYQIEYSSVSLIGTLKS